MSKITKSIKKQVKGTLSNMAAEPKMYARKIGKAYRNLPRNLKGLSKY